MHRLSCGLVLLRMCAEPAGCKPFSFGMSSQMIVSATFSAASRRSAGLHRRCPRPGPAGLETTRIGVRSRAPRVRRRQRRMHEQRFSRAASDGACIADLRESGIAKSAARGLGCDVFLSVRRVG
ncbi:hypothetical protein AZ78_4313 [Lysobacter capsici AZ78]|uniref:Uncharacterized protein n=1 Tax=Lysobacter capsici AZ78 TaxID=1444315 RepID=A0A120AHV4_9GAMM|nr:hypothetical protein AZ78_4313 [Lysobacter capsici AZ78]